MCTKLNERVLDAAELLFEHRTAALVSAEYNFKIKQKVEEYLWNILHRIGIDDSEMAERLIETKLVTSTNFNELADSIKNVWARLAWDIITKGSIQWPKYSRGIGG